MSDKIELGQTIRDRRSGLVGLVVGRVEWLDDVTPSLIVQPPAKDGTAPATVYVPEASAEVTPEAVPSIGFGR